MRREMLTRCGVLFRPGPDEDRPCACIGGWVFVGHLVEVEAGEEVEIVESVPCKRCAENGGK
jgi:hypothetical protein